MRPAIVIDWDGTVTERDTVQLMLAEFLPPHVFARIESETDAALDTGAMTLREVMQRELGSLRVPLEKVVAFLVASARVRPGFAEFVAAFDPLILSSSFHETIAPVLAREGVVARVRANHVEPNANGWKIWWTSDSECTNCGQHCKRGSLPAEPFVYVGDGYSDRCAALAARRVFACDRLAAYLDAQGIAYEPFTDFYALAAALGEPLVKHPSTSSG